jgi:DNA processing protein
MVLDEERLAKIALVHFPGFGSQRLRLLKHVFHSYATAWRAKRGELVQTRLPESVVDTFLAWRLKADPMKFVHVLEDARIRCLFPEDDDFPTLLRRSSDPPELLFVRGSISPAPAVAVVGTRKATSYGAHTTRELVTPLARAGLCIVSGLALGIDGIAHRAALEAQGPTAAFLATGIDDLSIYPKEHARLAEHILEAGGALVSESPPGTPGLKHLFPLRKRLTILICSD